MRRSATGAFVRGVLATTTLAASALSHVGWWLEWQTRATLREGSRPLD